MEDWGRIIMMIRLLLSLTISTMKTGISMRKDWMARMDRIWGRKGKEDWKRTLMREIISVAAERVTCLMPPSTPMPKPNIREFSLKEPPTFKRRASKARVPIAGRLTAATAICLKPTSTTRDSRSLLTWWSGLRVMEEETPTSVSSTFLMNTS